MYSRRIWNVASSNPVCCEIVEQLAWTLLKVACLGSVGRGKSGRSVARALGLCKCACPDGRIVGQHAYMRLNLPTSIQDDEHDHRERSPPVRRPVVHHTRMGVAPTGC